MGRKKHVFTFGIILGYLILFYVNHDVKAQISFNGWVPVQRLRMLEERYAVEHPQKTYANLKDLSRYTNITALAEDFVDHKFEINLSENKRYYTIKATVSEPYYGYCLSYLATPDYLTSVKTYKNVVKKCNELRERVIKREKVKDATLTLISFSPTIFPFLLLFRSFIMYRNNKITILRLAAHVILIVVCGVFTFLLGFVIRRLTSPSIP